MQLELRAQALEDRDIWLPDVSSQPGLPPPRGVLLQPLQVEEPTAWWLQAANSSATDQPVSSWATSSDFLSLEAK